MRNNLGKALAFSVSISVLHITRTANCIIVDFLSVYVHVVSLIYIGVDLKPGVRSFM